MFCLCLLCYFMCFPSVFSTMNNTFFLDISTTMMRDRLKNVIYMWPSHETPQLHSNTHAYSKFKFDRWKHSIYTCICLFNTHAHTPTVCIFGYNNEFHFLLFIHTIHHRSNYGSVYLCALLQYVFVW